MKNRNLVHSDNWATPDWLYKQLDDEFHFDCDAGGIGSFYTSMFQECADPVLKLPKLGSLGLPETVGSGTAPNQYYSLLT